MVLHTPIDYPIRSGVQDTSPASQLRQRKALPPTATAPTELSMATMANGDPLADDSTNNNHANHDHANNATKVDGAQLLQLHMQFARAFKLNDAARLLSFLDKDVALTTVDGAVVRGASAVLGCLVGPKMSKLSGGIHVKQARPARCGVQQSAFVYEHGLVFKEPLYSEVVDWARSDDGFVAVRIAHTLLSSPLDNGPPKSVADVVKVVAALPHRLSLSDDDDSGSSHSNNHSPTASSAATCSRRSSTQVSSGDAHQAPIGAVVTRVAVGSKLSPIRKRKLVNAFLTVESVDGVLLWKSSVAKKQLLPVWSGIDLEFPPPLDDDVVVTLWDYGLFRSLRVATAHTSAAQLLSDERAGLASLELKPMGLSFASVELTFSITRLSDERAWRPRSMSVVSTVAAVDAAMADYDDDEDAAASTALVIKSSMLSVDSAWLLATSALGVLLVCAALLWLHSSGQLMAK